MSGKPIAPQVKRVGAGDTGASSPVNQVTVRSDDEATVAAMAPPPPSPGSEEKEFVDAPGDFGGVIGETPLPTDYMRRDSLGSAAGLPDTPDAPVGEIPRSGETAAARTSLKPPQLRKKLAPLTISTVSEAASPPASPDQDGDAFHSPRGSNPALDAFPEVVYVGSQSSAPRTTGPIAKPASPPASPVVVSTPLPAANRAQTPGLSAAPSDRGPDSPDAPAATTASKTIKLEIDGEIVEFPIEDGALHPLSSSITGGIEGAAAVSGPNQEPCDILEDIASIKDQIESLQAQIAGEKDATAKRDLEDTLSITRSSLRDTTALYVDSINRNRGEDVPATRSPDGLKVEYKEEGKVVVTQTRDPKTKEVWYDVADGEGPRTIRVPRLDKDGKPTDVCDILQYDKEGKLVDAIIAREPEGSKSQIDMEKLKAARAARAKRATERAQATAFDASVSVREDTAIPRSPAKAAKRDAEEDVVDPLSPAGSPASANLRGIVSAEAGLARAAALEAEIRSTTMDGTYVAGAASSAAEKASLREAALSRQANPLVPSGPPASGVVPEVVINITQAPIAPTTPSNAVANAKLAARGGQLDTSTQFSTRTERLAYLETTKPVRRDINHGMTSSSAGDLDLPRKPTKAAINISEQSDRVRRMRSLFIDIARPAVVSSTTLRDGGALTAPAVPGPTSPQRGEGRGGAP